jgi:hypothetical protein
VDIIKLENQATGAVFATGKYLEKWRENRDL